MRLRLLAVLDRYLARELFPPFALGLLLFTLFLFVDRLYQLTDLVIARGAPLHLVAGLLGLMLPTFLAHTLPMAFLVAVLLAGGRLAGDLEVVALRAAGVGFLRLFRPVLAAALTVAGVAATLTLVVNPAVNREFQRQLFRIVEARAVTGLKERVFNTTFGDVVVYVEEISASQVALRGLLVSDERDPRLSRIITAREGRLLTDPQGRRITLRMLDGAVNEADVPVDTRRYRYTTFGVYDMTLSTQAARAARSDKPEREATVAMLLAAIARERANPAQRVPLEVELNKRMALPLAAIVFALMGFPLAVRSHRGGRSVALVATLTILVAYYLLSTTLEAVALKQKLPVGLALWLPNVAFGTVGGLLFAITAREWRPPPVGILWRVVDAVWEHLPRRAARLDERVGARDTTLLLDRYILRQFVVFIGVGVLVAATLFVIVDLMTDLDRYLRVKPPLRYILEHVVFRLPVAIYEGLPVVMLVATILLFLTLTRWHELTALKAAGISLYRTSAPVLLAALLVALGAGIFQELAVPFLNERGEEVDRVKIRGLLPRHLQTQSRLWLRTSDTRFYRVDLMNPATGELSGLTLLDVGRDFHLTRRVDAQRARWADGVWTLTGGAVRELEAGGRLRATPFIRLSLRLEETIRDFTEVQKSATSMSYLELREYVARLEAAGFHVRKYLVDLHAKLSTPLKNLIMVLVAIPLALQAPRSGRLYGIALAIAIMAGYLLVDYSARAFARAELLPPLLAAWTANVVFGGLGVSLLLRART